MQNDYTQRIEKAIIADIERIVDVPQSMFKGTHYGLSVELPAPHKDDEIDWTIAMLSSSLREKINENQAHRVYTKVFATQKDERSTMYYVIATM
jgi:hypothetical protein